MSIRQVDFANGTVLPKAKSPEFCFSSQCASVQDTAVCIGLSDSGNLYVTDAAVSTLSSNVTSFTIASGFVIFTSTSHEASFVPMVALLSEIVLEKRKIERGSRIVTA